MQVDLSPFVAVTPEAAAVPNVALYTVSYYSDDLLVKAALAVPESFLADEAKLPALLYCRGGIRGIGRVRPERISQMAAFGYVVLAPHYRGNEGEKGATSLAEPIGRMCSRPMSCFVN